jgi:hypothetical protein
MRRPIALLCLAAATACPPADPANETGATTGDPATTAATEPTSTSTATTGDPPVDGCNQPDPSTRASFAFDLGDVPGADAFAVDLELACTVTAVAIEGDMIATDLNCQLETDATYDITFDVAATDLGAPVWSAAEPVTLRVRGAQDFGGLIDTGGGSLVEVELALHRDADGMLLASATRSYKATPDLYIPLSLAPDRDACGTDLPQDDPNFPGPDRDMSVTFALADTETTLFTKQRSQLAHGSDLLAIDVDEATAIECCHAELWLIAVTRLVKPG